MSRIKLILVSLLAVFVISSVAAGSASAAGNCTPNDENELVVCAEPNAGEFKELNEVKAPGNKLINTEKGTKSILTAKVGTTEVEIECTSYSIEDKEGATDSSSTGDIEFVKGTCTVKKPVTGINRLCVVKNEPIVAKFTDLLGGTLAKPTVTLTGSESINKRFATIEFANAVGQTCPLAGKSFDLTGSQECKFDAASGTQQEAHEVICAKAGSKLELGVANKAEFEGTFKGIVVEAGGTGKHGKWAIEES